MLLDKKVYLIKEQVQFMKLAGTYDIYDPESNKQIGVAKEEPGGLIKLLRFLINKKMLPNKVNVYDYQDQNIVFYIKKPANFIRSKVMIYNQKEEFIGYFKSKLLTIGGGFFVYNANEQEVAEIKGDWKGWNFNFIDNQGKEIGIITKKWAGIGKELFTSADSYILSINDMGEYGQEESILLLAAGIAIDTIFKENK